MKINISKEALRFGLNLGFKLSRLEWIWGSEIKEAKEAFEGTKADILAQLPLNDLHVNNSDYRNFAQSIISYYFRVDNAICSSIFIGIAVQRCSLIGSSSNESKNNEIEKLAKSSLETIPSSMVSDKDALFEVIKSHKGKNLFTIIDEVEKLTDENNETGETEKMPTLFLSYCHQDAPIAKKIVENFSKKNIKISIDKNVAYKESFKTFMNSIQDHDFVLCLVSDNYLKSKGCLYEVGEVLKNHRFKERLFFIILSEEDRKYYPATYNYKPANIYKDTEHRLYYKKYWINKYKTLDEQINEINDKTATINEIKELREIEKIKFDIGDFLEYLADSNGKDFDYLQNHDFSDIVKWINQKK